MRVTIVGAGAIGGTTGVMLHHTGHDVTLVDRDAAHVAAINQNGYRLSGYVDLVEPVPAITTDQLAAHIEQHGPLGMVVLAVKAMDTEAAATMIAPFLAPDGFIVSYQNGLNEERIAPIVGPARTIGAFIHFGGDLMEPGHVVLANRVTTYLSELDGERTPRIEEIARVLSAVTPVEITDNLNGYLWGKLCYAALGFAVSVVDAPVDVILDANPGVRPAVRGVVAEVVDVAHAQGLRLENIHGFDPNLFARENPERIAQTDRFFDEWSARGKSSIKRHMGIHRDIKVRKRRTEVDFQVAPVVERGRELGVPTPLLERLVTIVHDVETAKRPQGWSTIEELNDAARDAGER
ncbi:MAG TPA: ketopantoate reductase family protein [Nitrolancea sp.]